MESEDSAARPKAKFFQAAALAFSFLSVIPVRSRWLTGVGPVDLARSFVFFPLVGIVLGGLAVLPAALTGQRGSPLLHAALITAILCSLTRGLHLDGLADVADGFGGGYTPERRLEIMKDSRTGAFGVAAVVFVIVLKVSALEILMQRHLLHSICLGATLSRFAMVATAYRSSYARREGGLGKSFVEHISTLQMSAASVLALGLSLLLSGFSAIPAIVVTLALVFLARVTSRHMIGGVTGDVLGAVNELSETLIWIVLAFVI